MLFAHIFSPPIFLQSLTINVVQFGSVRSFCSHSAPPDADLCFVCIDNRAATARRRDRNYVGCEIRSLWVCHFGFPTGGDTLGQNKRTVPSDRPSSSRNRKHGFSWCARWLQRTAVFLFARGGAKSAAREKQRKKKPDSLATKVKIVCECERERQVLVNIDASIRAHVDAFNDRLGVIETPITWSQPFIYVQCAVCIFDVFLLSIQFIPRLMASMCVGRSGTPIQNMRHTIANYIKKRIQIAQCERAFFFFSILSTIAIANGIARWKYLGSDRVAPMKYRRLVSFALLNA